MTSITTSKTRASISLEACLCLVPVLILLITFAHILYANLLFMDLAFALENVGEEAGLVFTLGDQASQKLSLSFDDIWPQSLQGEDMASVRDLASNFGSSLALGPILEARLDHWLNALRGEGGYSLGRHQRKIYLEWDLTGHCLLLSLDASVDTFFGPYERQLFSCVPLWSDYVPGEGEDKASKEEEADDIWSQGNFVRGDFFRKKAGANLPFNFPVICYYQGGRAKSVRSLDPNAPSYASQDLAYKSIKRDLDRLANFTSYQGRSSSGVSIAPGDIRQKTYVLYLPENVPAQYQDGFFENLEQEAQAQGLLMEIHRYGQSKAYAHDGND